MAFALVFLLSGCGNFGRTLFQSQHEDSGVPPGKFEIFILQVQAAKSANEAEVVKLSNVSEAERTAIGSHCAEAVPRGAFDPALAPVAAIVIVAALSIATSAAEAAYGRYVAAREKEYSSKFEKAQNLFVVEDGWPKFNCIVGRITSSTIDQGDTTDFSFAAVLTPSFDPETSTITTPIAFQWVPTYYLINRSSARTDSSGLVDVSVGIKLTGVADKEAQAISEVILAFKGLCLKGGKSEDCGKMRTMQWNPEAKAKSEREELPVGPSNASPWFPIPGVNASSPCRGVCVPGALSLSILETGTGAPDFGAARTELSNTNDAIANAIGKIIELKTNK